MLRLNLSLLLRQLWERPCCLHISGNMADVAYSSVFPPRTSTLRQEHVYWRWPLVTQSLLPAWGDAHLLAWARSFHSWHHPPHHSSCGQGPEPRKVPGPACHTISTRGDGDGGAARFSCPGHQENLWIWARWEACLGIWSSGQNLGQLALWPDSCGWPGDLLSFWALWDSWADGHWWEEIPEAF